MIVQAICLFVTLQVGEPVPVEIFPNSAVGHDSCAGALLEMTNAIKTGGEVRCRVCAITTVKADSDE